MIKTLALLVSHSIALAAGFALGIYLLPILIAPDAPSDADVASVSQQAMFTATFTRDLPGSDFLHWGEGDLSITARRVSFSGELAPGPDYRLYLTRELVLDEPSFLAIKSEAAYVGDIKTFDNFLIEIPENINPADYTAAVVWCETFGEFITAATYR